MGKKATAKAMRYRPIEKMVDWLEDMAKYKNGYEYADASLVHADAKYLLMLIRRFNKREIIENMVMLTGE